MSPTYESYVVDVRWPSRLNHAGEFTRMHDLVADNHRAEQTFERLL